MPAASFPPSNLGTFRTRQSVWEMIKPPSSLALRSVTATCLRCWASRRIRDRDADVEKRENLMVPERSALQTYTVSPWMPVLGVTSSPVRSALMLLPSA